MATDFKINSSTLTHITNASWSEQAEGSYLNGKMPKNRWRIMRLSGTMEEAQFDLIYAQEGAKVSITVPPYDSRNSDFETYYGADLISIEGEHQGPSFVNVRAELRVLI